MRSPSSLYYLFWKQQLSFIKYALFMSMSNDFLTVILNELKMPTLKLSKLPFLRRPMLRDANPHKEKLSVVFNNF